MTIHDGEFKKGLALLEQSVAEFPLALAYRNLAVYWNSEGDFLRATTIRKSPRARPKRPLQPGICRGIHGGAGNREEALKIARANESCCRLLTTWRRFTRKTGQKRLWLS